MHHKPLFFVGSYFIFPLALLISSCQTIPASMPFLQANDLENAYEQYHETSLTHRRFRHADIIPLLNNRKVVFTVEEIGQSVQGRGIFQLTYGKGPLRVMLWSQMHGNESTATLALFDLFNFLEGNHDGYDTLRNLIREKLHILFIPMLNPDGAEVFQRRNALDIDINRDAIQTASPEAATLKTARERFQPAFGFNLHDQQIYYNVSGTAKPATISVLAPAYNEPREINKVRTRSMQLAVGMNRLVQQLIPGHVGKYDDTFEPRAFGDNFQKWGTSTVLVESGGFPDDPEKQFIRKLNFMLILNALYELATGAYAQHDLKEYEAIPDNDSKLVDLLIRGISIEQQGKKYNMDLGIKKTEKENDDGFDIAAAVSDLGDLSVFYGYEEIDAHGLEFKTGNIWKGRFNRVEEVSWDKAWDLLKQGYMAIRVAHQPDTAHRLPLVVVKEERDFKSGFKIGQPANFYLTRGDELVYAVVNGNLINLEGR